ncbi:MAG: hypothetical protein RLZZ601_694 [Pseudomonadota bacterium]
MKYKKKLIEVALPLEAINAASASEKGNPFLRGHPRNLHQWWARRPQVAARAVIFAQMVDDPSGHPDIFRTEKAQEKERQRLFALIESMVQWENSSDEALMENVRNEILQSWRYTCAENSDHPRAKILFDRFKLPPFHDPFAGGGALPLEGQRLGFESFASDLNPVAVLINKALIEVPPKFSGCSPVNPDSVDLKNKMDTVWSGAHGLADDVRYYGKWMCDEATKIVGHLYPKITVTPDLCDKQPSLLKYKNQTLTISTCLWVRTVKSPNPAFLDIDVPLASTFLISGKVGKEAYVQPLICNKGYKFSIKFGKPDDINTVKLGTTAGKRAAFKCLMSGVPIPYDYVRSEGKAGRMGIKLMAIVAEGDRERVYLPPIAEIEEAALTSRPAWSPEELISTNPRDFRSANYGLATFGDLFTNRQLEGLTVFADLIPKLRDRVKNDAKANGVPVDAVTLENGGSGADAYADAIALYMALAIDKLADYNNSICTWNPTNQNVGHLFSKQAIPMAWDFCETSPIYGGLSIVAFSEGIAKTIEALPAIGTGYAFQHDCAMQSPLDRMPVYSTDPPYYDNIGYADLSDFFYVWLRRSLKSVFPGLFSTLVVPKSEELVATPYRHGGKENAEKFFLEGMTDAMHRLSESAHPAFPVTIYYAFKQGESDGEDGTTNTGWDTFLAAVIRAGFSISGTWPLRTERGARAVGIGTNALASSILLVCRKKSENSPAATRGEFVAALKAELPAALRHLQAGNIAPVDLAQAAIGPGMAVYTRYSRVLDAEGKELPVRVALSLINQVLDEALAEQEGDFDGDSRWAVTWFEQNGFAEGDYGSAEQLSVSRNTSVEGLVSAGIISSKAGKVRLLRPVELNKNWDPLSDKRITAWEIVHQLIKSLESGGEKDAALLVSKLGAYAEIARELCYRLYTVCERKKRAVEAMSYNGLVQSWPEINRLARGVAPINIPKINDLFDQE